MCIRDSLTGVLQKLSVVDAFKEDQLLVFLDLVLQLAAYPGISDGEVLSLIYPYCRGSLAEKVTNTWRRGGTVDTFHGEVLDYFIYPPRRSQLKWDLFYRFQANGEALGDYVQDIRKAARVLRLGLPDTEVLDVIMEGLNPQDRSRLIFAGRPRCFAEMARFCVVSNTVRPELAVIIPVNPFLYMTDPDPVTSSSPTPEDEKSHDGGALPSSVEFNLDIAHGPGPVSYTHLDVYKRQASCCFVIW